MYDASNFQNGFGTKNLDRTENHRMLGFQLLREDVDAVDASLGDVTEIVDMSRSVNGRDNTLMIACQRTAGEGVFEADVYAILPGDAVGTVLPFEVYVGSVDQPTATGLKVLNSLPAAKYKIQVKGVGTGTWQVYVAYSGNLKAVSG